MAEGGGTENQIDSELQATAFYQWREEGRSKVTPEEDFELLTSQTLVVKFIPLKNQEGPLSSINGGKKEKVKEQRNKCHSLDEGLEESLKMGDDWKKTIPLLIQRVQEVWQEKQESVAINEKLQHEISAVQDKVQGLEIDNEMLRNKCHSLDERHTESLKESHNWEKKTSHLIQRIQEVLQEKQESMASMEKQLHEFSAVKDKVQGLEIDNEMWRNKCYSLDERLAESLKESHNLEKKKTNLHQLMKKALHELQEEKEMNKGMRKNQSVWQESVACSEKQLHELSTLKDKEIQDLKDQVRDVMIHMEAQQKLSTTTGVTQEEIQEGQVVVGAASTATSLNRKPRKKKR